MRVERRRLGQPDDARGDAALVVEHDGRRHGLQRARRPESAATRRRRGRRSTGTAPRTVRWKACAAPASSVWLMPSTLHAVGGVVVREGRRGRAPRRGTARTRRTRCSARRRRRASRRRPDAVALEVGARDGSSGSSRSPAAQCARCRRRTRSPGRRRRSGVVVRADAASSPAASDGRQRRPQRAQRARTPHVTPPRPVGARAAGPRPARCSGCRRACRRRSAGRSATRARTAAGAGRATGDGPRARAA